MTTYHQFERDGRRFRFVYDESHETRGSYAYDTEEETHAAEDHEIAMLESGTWVVLGCIVSEPCEGHSGAHCEACTGWNETDSLWGIVIENTTGEAEQVAATSF